MATQANPTSTIDPESSAAPTYDVAASTVPTRLATSESSVEQQKTDSGRPVTKTAPPAAKTKWRRLIFKLHMVTGLAVGLYILLMSVTGCALVFYDEISLLSNPKVAVGAHRQSLSRIANTVKSKYATHQITWIHQTTLPDSPLEVLIENEGNQQVVLVNPYTEEIVGEKVQILLWLKDLHVNLLLGSNGRTLNGVGAVLLLALAATGLTIWVSRSGKIVTRLSINFKANWKRINFDSHSAMGIWMFPMILIWGTSAVYFAFPESFENALKYVIFEDNRRKDSPARNASSPAQNAQKKSATAPPPAVGTNSSAPLDLDAIIKKAKLQAPGLHPSWIKMPSKDSSLTHISFVDSTGSTLGSDDSITRVSIDSLNGQITHFSRPEDRETRERVLSWLSSLHFGNFGGILSKTLWVVAGLTPGLLFATGAIMWWNRVLSKYLKKLNRP